MSFFESYCLRDMIDSDIRNYKAETGDVDFSLSLGASNLDSASHHLNSFVDSDLSDEGGPGWMNSSQMFNNSAEIDELSCVDPQTVLPVSIPMPVLTTSADKNSVLSTNNSLTIATTKSIAMTLPTQLITTNSDLTDANLISSLPTPSPSPHNTSQQLYSEQDTDTSQDSGDSPKPKYKNKSVKQQSGVENTYPKPAYSYSCLIAMALKNSKTGSLPVNEIYDFMTENFPYFKTAPNGWKNSVRHNLSLNKCFEKIEKPSGNAQRKGYLWAMNPAKIEKMEEELQKWGSKDPAAIRKSMANPERLELIEKGELRNDSDPEVEDMNISQEEEAQEEKENEIKGHSMTNDLLNGDFPALVDSVNIDPIELDLQKGIWDDLCEDRLQFITDSPSSPLSPKNSEHMEEESESAPSSQLPRLYHASYIYKNVQRAPDPNIRKFTPIKSGSGKSAA